MNVYSMRQQKWNHWKKNLFSKQQIFNSSLLNSNEFRRAGSTFQVECTSLNFNLSAVTLSPRRTSFEELLFSSHELQDFKWITANYCWNMSSHISLTLSSSLASSNSKFCVRSFFRTPISMNYWTNIHIFSVHIQFIWFGKIFHFHFEDSIFVDLTCMY